jgi:hypothetical protein
MAKPYKPRRILVERFNETADKRSVYVAKQYAELGIDGEELDIIGQSDFDALSVDEQTNYRLCDYYRIMYWKDGWCYDDYCVEKSKLCLHDMTTPQTISTTELKALIKRCKED